MFSILNFVEHTHTDTQTRREPLGVTKKKVHIEIWFDSLSYYQLMWIICFMFDVIPPLQKSKTGKDQKYISFKKTKMVLLLLHLRGKNFQKHKNKIQVLSLQNTILLTTTIAIATTTTTLQCGEISFCLLVQLENDSRGGSKTKCLFSRALKHKYFFINIINLFFI